MLTIDERIDAALTTNKGIVVGKGKQANALKALSRLNFFSLVLIVSTVVIAYFLYYFLRIFI